MHLSICIPSYNRIDCLENCLNSILISSKKNSNFNFEVCVSDNASKIDPIKIINKFKPYLNIKYNRNKTNLGFALNAIETVRLAKGKYIWIIGNDDLILPETFQELDLMFSRNPDIKFFFINSFYLNSKFVKKYAHPFNTMELKKIKMKKLSKVTESKRVNFWKIIDPKVSWEFLIGIFLSISDRRLWIEGLKFIDKEKIKDTKVWSNFDNTCLNAIIVATMFKKEKSFICSQPLSVNLIGEREWINLYDFVEIVRIPELLDYYRSQGLSFFRYIYCKNFSLRNFFNFFTKIMIFGNKSGRQYVKFYDHFFKNLIYPYAWLSVIFFANRFFIKIIKKFL